MPDYTIKINRAALLKKFDQAIRKNKKVEDLALKLATSYFKRAKSSMLKEFNEHPITVELDMGPEGLNISNTLDGYGNLFSFLGFYAGTKPTEPLRLLLENSIQIKQTVYRNKKWYFRVTTPNIYEIENQTQMVWEPDSWATGVERGISGLSFFLYKKTNPSRSQAGVQLPWEYSDGAEFQPKPYITEILGNFRDKINNR